MTVSIKIRFDFMALFQNIILEYGTSFYRSIPSRSIMVVFGIIATDFRLNGHKMGVTGIQS
jgi:hypothetical protein